MANDAALRAPCSRMSDREMDMFDLIRESAAFAALFWLNLLICFHVCAIIALGYVVIAKGV